MICRHLDTQSSTWEILHSKGVAELIAESRAAAIAPVIEDPEAVYKGFYMTAVVAHGADNSLFGAGTKSSSLSIDEQICESPNMSDTIDYF